MLLDCLNARSSDVSKRIQDELDSPDVKLLELPPGEWRIQSTLNVRAWQTLRIGRGTSLFQDVPTIKTPMVRLAGNHATLDGGGFIRSRGDSPDGIVAIGPETNDRLFNICWPRVQDVKIEGTGQPKTYGIKLTSSEATHSGSCYFAQMFDVWISSVDVGIHAGLKCNGLQGRNVQFYQIKSHSYWLQNNTNSIFNGGFTHLSHTMRSVVRCQDCYGHVFLGVMAEPGVPKTGTAPKYHEFERSPRCVFIGYDECGTGSAPGEQPFTVSHGVMNIDEINVRKITYQDMARRPTT